MRFFNFLVFLLCMLFLVGCPDAHQIQVQTANSIAIASNAALPTLVGEYKQQGVTAINLSKTEEEATKKILAIQEKWQPIWKAWETLRVAHSAWADVLESNGDWLASLLALKNAYCGLLLVWPKEIPAIPMASVVCGVPK